MSPALRECWRLPPRLDSFRQFYERKSAVIDFLVHCAEYQAEEMVRNGHFAAVKTVKMTTRLHNTVWLDAIAGCRRSMVTCVQFDIPRANLLSHAVRRILSAPM